MRVASIFIWFFPLLFAASADAEIPAKVVTAVRTSLPPRLDGKLNEKEWASVPAVLDFTQFDPVEGALPTEITSVRILYTDNALYVGAICYDTKPELIVGQLTRRDRSGEADRFTVMIDSHHDRQNAFVFSTNVSGIQSDGVLSQDGNVYDITWDAVWQVETQQHQDGWSAEFEIPYNVLRFAEQAGDSHEWGINFRRYVSRKRETIEWVMVPRSEHLQISQWGYVTGIRGIVPPLHLELLPYVSGLSEHQTASAFRPSNSRNDVLVGLDAKYGLVRNFTLDAAINPDFGQVEVDQAVLNLTVFETRFPEKRPFFTEGSQLFTFGASVDETNLPLFFSRRIGRRPSGSAVVATPPGGAVKENPLSTTILGAAKLTGRSQSGLSVGAITAVTDEESAVLVNAAGTRTSIRTEPFGTYNAVRLKQDFDGTSWFGGIATLVSRDERLPAMSGGLDWNIRIDENTYTLEGYLAGTRSAVATQGRNGAAGKLLFARISAEHWHYLAEYDFFSRRFDCNDIGFFAQPHDHGGSLQLLYRENFATGIFRRYALSLNPEYRWNWDGVMTRATMKTEASAEFKNFWRASISYVPHLPYYVDAERGIIGTYKRPTAHEFAAEVVSDERGPVSGSLTTTYGTDERGRHAFAGLVGLTLRPSAWLELSPLLLYAHVRDEEAWVFPYGNIVDPAVSVSPFSVFGDRDIDELDVALRGTVTFTRRLSLQFYSQILLARGRYDNFRRLQSGTNLVAYNYTAHPDYRNPDFNQITFNANILLRWEYVQGSTLYLVWTQGRYGTIANYATGFAQRITDTFSLPHDDVLLLKVSYWLPL